MYTSLDASQSVPGTLYDNTMIFQDLFDWLFFAMPIQLFFSLQVNSCAQQPPFPPASRLF